MKRATKPDLRAEAAAHRKEARRGASIFPHLAAAEALELRARDADTPTIESPALVLTGSDRAADCNPDQNSLF